MRYVSRHPLIAIWILGLLGLIPLPARAGELSLPDTEMRALHSNANGVDYKLYVSLPHDYATSGKHYPVVYLLDADYSFPVARAVVTHLSDRDDIQPLIVVGIAYGGPLRYKLNRTRDYTPTFVPDGGYGAEFQKYSGGAPKFRKFLGDELFPWIDRHYRTVKGDRTFVGHSYGGLFGSWILLTAPQLFSRFILVSPSLWYDHQMMFDLERKGREAGIAPAAKVYFAVGSREHGGVETESMVNDLARFVELLESRKLPDLAIKHEVFEDETHDSVFPTAFSRGLRWVFDGK